MAEGCSSVFSSCSSNNPIRLRAGGKIRRSPNHPWHGVCIKKIKVDYNVTFDFQASIDMMTGSATTEEQHNSGSGSPCQSPPPPPPPTHPPDLLALPTTPLLSRSRSSHQGSMGRLSSEKSHAIAVESNNAYSNCAVMVNPPSPTTEISSTSHVINSTTLNWNNCAFETLKLWSRGPAGPFLELLCMNVYSQYFVI